MIGRGIFLVGEAAFLVLGAISVGLLEPMGVLYAFAGAGICRMIRGYAGGYER